MNSREFAELDRNTLQVVQKFVEQGLNETQFRYLCETKGVDPDTVVAAVSFLERVGTVRFFVRCFLCLIALELFCRLILFISS